MIFRHRDIQNNSLRPDNELNIRIAFLRHHTHELQTFEYGPVFWPIMQLHFIRLFYKYIWIKHFISKILFIYILQAKSGIWFPSDLWASAALWVARIVRFASGHSHAAEMTETVVAVVGSEGRNAPALCDVARSCTSRDVIRDEIYVA